MIGEDIIRMSDNKTLTIYGTLGELIILLDENNRFHIVKPEKFVKHYKFFDYSERIRRGKE